MIPQTQKDAGGGSTGYEPSDLSPQPVAWVGLTVAVALLLFGFVLNRWLSHRSAHGAPLKAVSLASVDPQNPLGSESDTPPLQRDEIADEAKRRQDQLAKLHSYGHTADGSIHIPIEATISLILARGLPSLKDQAMQNGPKARP